MRRLRDFLKNPYIQSAVLFTAFGMLMVRHPKDAASLVFWPLLLISLVPPLAMAFQADWWPSIRQANNAVILGWLAVIALMAGLAPSGYHWKTGEFWRLALFYPYAVLFSALLRLFRTPIQRAVQTYTRRI